MINLNVNEMETLIGLLNNSIRGTIKLQETWKVDGEPYKDAIKKSEKQINDRFDLLNKLKMCKIKMELGVS